MWRVNTLGVPKNFDPLHAPASYAWLLKQIMADDIGWGLAYAMGSTLV